MSNTRMQNRLPRKALRTALVVALSLSMVLGGVPVPALQAFADEVDDLMPIEEPVVDPTEGEGEPEGEGAQGEESQGEDQPGEGEEQGEEQPGEGEDQPSEGEEGDLPAEVVETPKPAKERNKALKAAMPGPSADGLVHAWADPDTRKTVDTNALGFTINLFNYDAYDQTPIQNSYDRDPNNQNTGTGINAGKNKANQLKFYETGDGVTTSQAQFTSGTNPGNGINQFTGVGNNGGSNFYTLQYANQGIVQRTLSGSDSDNSKMRFPLLNTNASDKTTDYIFDTTPTASKDVYAGVNNLFYLHNEGQANELLVYDSNESYAYYDVSQGDGGDFTIYDGTYDRAGGSKSGMKVGFFPFNQFAAPGATPCINPNESAWRNGVIDHHLGLTLNVPMTMPYNGKIRHTADDGTVTETDMIFEFSGDDDMWVFVDGKLVLDIGGIHQPVSGSINFATGEIKLGMGTANQPVDASGNVYTQNGHFSYAATGIEDTNVIGDTAWLWTENGHTGILGPRESSANRAGTEHVLQAFYLERGGCDSNLMISTNIHLMAPKKVEVSKEWDESIADSDKTPVQVQIIRKAVSRDTDSDGDPVSTTYAPVVFDKLSESDLAAGETQLENPAMIYDANEWNYLWSKLPAEGYNASGVFDESEGASNYYCDYTYYVREVPSADQPFVPEYYDVATNADGTKTRTQLVPEEICYHVIENGDGTLTELTGDFVPVSEDYNPIVMVNRPVTLDIEKEWNNAAGTGRDGVNHNADDNADAVWVRLYKQTRVQERVNIGTSDLPAYVKVNVEPEAWNDPTVVGTYKLTNENKVDGQQNVWRITDIPAVPGDNVRYYIEEGTAAAADGNDFVAKITFNAAKTTSDSEGAPYVIDGTSYARNGVRKVGPVAQPTINTDDVIKEKRSYYWQTSGTAGQDDYTVVRTFDGDAELVQYGGEATEYTTDILPLVLEAPAADANPEGYTFVATIDLGALQLDGEIGKITKPAGVELVLNDGKIEARVAMAANAEAKSVKLGIPVKAASGALSAITKDSPATVNISQTKYLKAAGANSTEDVSQGLHGDYLSLDATYTHGTATVANKPIKLLKLRKVDAKAYDEATKKADAYNEEHPDETPAKTFVDYLATDDYLKGAEFVLCKDDGTMDDNQKPFFNETADMASDQRIPDATTTFSTNDKGTVNLTTLTDKGTYWLVETKAPTGYICRGTEHPIQIDVDENGVVSLAPMTGEAATKPTMQSAKGVDTITVPNVRTYALPAAGGPGAYPFLVAGAFVAAYAVAGFGSRNRRVTRRRSAKSN